ncbi:hypothetical protein Drorol1_Dr00013663, partial [Drosera rotundifolia]
VAFHAQDLQPPIKNSAIFEEPETCKILHAEICSRQGRKRGTSTREKDVAEKGRIRENLQPTHGRGANKKRSCTEREGSSIFDGNKPEMETEPLREGRHAVEEVVTAFQLAVHCRTAHCRCHPAAISSRNLHVSCFSY